MSISQHTSFHTYAFISWLSIVPLWIQTRDALNEEVTKEGLNVIHSVSFPTDQNPQRSVRSLQVGDWSETSFIIWMFRANHWFLHIPIGVKWKDHFLKLLFRICTWDSLPSMCWLVPHVRSKCWCMSCHVQASILGMVPPRYAWITYGWIHETFWEKSPSNKTYRVFDQCSRQQLISIVNQMIVIHSDPHYDKKDTGNPIIGNWVRSTIIITTEGTLCANYSDPCLERHYKC